MYDRLHIQDVRLTLRARGAVQLRLANTETKEKMSIFESKFNRLDSVYD